MSQPAHSDSARKAPRTDLILGVAFVVLSCVIAFVWVPYGVDSGIFEKVRRRVEIGDAFAPTLAAGLLALGGIMLILEARRAPSDARLTRTNLGYLLALCAVFCTVSALWMWTGPALVALTTEAGEYRLLRDSWPWKYTGFVAGGTVLVTGLISLTERRLSFGNLLIGIAASLAMIALYDLPFDDLLLPPNGDY